MPGLYIEDKIYIHVEYNKIRIVSLLLFIGAFAIAAVCDYEMTGLIVYVFIVLIASAFVLFFTQLYILYDKSSENFSYIYKFLFFKYRKIISPIQAFTAVIIKSTVTIGPYFARMNTYKVCLSSFNRTTFLGKISSIEIDKIIRLAHYYGYEIKYEESDGPPHLL